MSISQIIKKFLIIEGIFPIVLLEKFENYRYFITYLNWLLIIMVLKISQWID